MHTQSIDVIL